MRTCMYMIIILLLPLMVLTLGGMDHSYSAIKFVGMVIDHTVSICIASISIHKLYVAISFINVKMKPSYHSHK